MVMTSMISWGWNMALRMTFFVAWDSMSDLEKDTGSFAGSCAILKSKENEREWYQTFILERRISQIGMHRAHRVARAF